MLLSTLAAPKVLLLILYIVLYLTPSSYLGSFATAWFLSFRIVLKPLSFTACVFQLFSANFIHVFFCRKHKQEQENPRINANWKQMDNSLKSAVSFASPKPQLFFLLDFRYEWECTWKFLLHQLVPERTCTPSVNGWYLYPSVNGSSQKIKDESDPSGAKTFQKIIPVNMVPPPSLGQTGAANLLLGVPTWQKGWCWIL